MSNRNLTANLHANSQGWGSKLLKTKFFSLKSYEAKKASTAEVINVYIEGDGLSWLNVRTPSSNPTPINPVGLKLALKDRNTAVYLARPCQFVNLAEDRNCNKIYWTSHRYSPEVVNSISSAIDQVKTAYRAKKLKLIGYSGGGTLAALVTANRTDVEQLVTIAGNLDTAAWATRNKLTPLIGSLNPADFHEKLASTNQIHFIGGKDANTSVADLSSYISKFSNTAKIKVIVIDEYDHVCCWEKDWPSLIEKYLYH